jgi:hypothetical protein
MRLTGTQSALIAGSVLGVLMVLLNVNREEGASVNANAPASSEQNDIVKGPGKERASHTSPSGNGRLQKPVAPHDSQVFSSGNIARAGVPVHASQTPKAEEDATPVREDARRSAVAFPFRPSPTIVERCRTRPAPTADSCKEVNRLVEEMSREDRDEAWAKRTESRIRAVVAARQDGTQIRALECKTSLCAIETVSPATRFLSILLQAEQESAGVVDDGDFVLGWEEDPTHGRLTITVSVFGRRIQ